MAIHPNFPLSPYEILNPKRAQTPGRRRGFRTNRIREQNRPDKGAPLGDVERGHRRRVDDIRRHGDVLRLEP